MEKPIGTYECMVCKKLWGEDEIHEYSGRRLGCGNLFCGANVRRISDIPKPEYLQTLENKLKD